MHSTLDKKAVSEWLVGQRAAAERIEAERTRFLLALTPERSLQLYLSLGLHDRNRRTGTPSPVLVAMRRLLAQAREGG